MVSKSVETFWYSLALRASDAGADAVAALVADLGYPACEQRTSGDGGSEVVVYSQEVDEASARREAARLIAALPTAALDAQPLGDVAVIDEKVWTHNWRSHFPRLRVGRRLMIAPPWDAHDSDDADRVVVVLNPGLAFGTGHHETTRGCLQLLDELVVDTTSVADIGCGSGILAIAAAKLGARHVWAGDSDPQAVDAARENAAANAVAERVHAVVAEGPPPPSAGPEGAGFALVVANIYAETLIEMEGSLSPCVEAGGTLVLSGIESARRSLVEDAFARAGWTVYAPSVLGAWTTLALRRGQPARIRQPVRTTARI